VPYLHCLSICVLLIWYFKSEYCVSRMTFCDYPSFAFWCNFSIFLLQKRKFSIFLHYLKASTQFCFLLSLNYPCPKPWMPARLLSTSQSAITIKIINSSPSCSRVNRLSLPAATQHTPATFVCHVVTLYPCYMLQWIHKNTFACESLQFFSLYIICNVG
jgi:hypothetical protein